MDTSSVLHYKYLAFMVIRDAMGFYIGIPRFLEPENLQVMRDNSLSEKLGIARKQKNRDLTSGEIDKCIKSVEKALFARIQDLTEDLKHAESTLFEDNLWLQWLGLDPEFLSTYLKRMSPETKESLAVVPKWGIKDHSLGRSYINDKFLYNVSSYE